MLTICNENNYGVCIVGTLQIFQSIFICTTSMLYQVDNVTLLLILSGLILILKIAEITVLQNSKFKGLQYQPIHALQYFLTFAIYLELNIQKNDLDNLSKQTSTILFALMFKNLDINLADSKKYLLLFIPLYAMIRLIVMAFISANYYILESISIIICFVVLFLLEQQKMNPFLQETQILNEQNNFDITGVRQEVQRVDSPQFRSRRSFTGRVMSQQQVNNEYQKHKNQNLREVKDQLLRYSEQRIIIQRQQQSFKMVDGFSDKSKYSINELENQNNNDYIQSFYHNLLNSFPDGIVIINHRQQISFINTQCEKLLACDSRDKILQKLRETIIQSQIVTSLQKGNKKNKSSQNSKLYEDIIKLAQLTNSSQEVLEQLLYPTKYQQVISPASVSEHSKIVLKSHSQASYEVALPYIKLLQYQNNGTPKQIKIKIVQSFMKESLQDYPNNGQGNFSSPVQIDSQPILLIIIKNVTVKQTLKELRNDYDFQNSLLQSFSHELRTPLNCSNQLLSVVEELAKDNQKIIRYIKSIQSCNQLLTYQINDILDFAAFECNNFQYKWESILFQDIIDGIFNIFKDSCEEKEIKLLSNIDPGLQGYVFITDESRLLQILINLMNNAIKFTPHHGKITIKAKIINKETKLIKMQIKDNGAGLMADQLSELKNSLKKNLDMVESMHHSKKSNKNSAGTGLGMNISNKILRGLAEGKDNNFLEIISKKNKGTKVSFQISNQIIVENMQSRSEITNTFNPLYNMAEICSPSKLTPPIQKSLFFKRMSATSEVLDEDQFGPQYSSNWNTSKSIHNDQNIIIPKLPQSFFQNVDFSKGARFSIKDSKKSNIESQELLDDDYIDLKISDYVEQDICKQCVSILIVDDIPFNHLALKALLKLYNLPCDQAHDGYEAIQMVKNKLLAHCKTYRLIFMDIGMPGIDGFETTIQIQKFLQNNGLQSSIIMSSALDTADNFQKAQEIGMAGILPKPVRKQQLERVIKQFLRH